MNLTGQFLCAREAVREFKRRGVRPEVSCSAGKILCISSVHEVIPWAGHVNYAASKGGVMLMMKSIAQEVAPYRIRVNSISPGAIRTPINTAAWDTPEAYDDLLKLIPYKRIGEADEIGRAAVWLASDYADYIHGVSLFVDGGMTLYPGFETGASRHVAARTHALARVPHRSVGARHVHGVGRSVHRADRASRFRRAGARRERGRAARADRPRDGCDGGGADLLAVGPALRRAHEPGRDADVLAARPSRSATTRCGSSPRSSPAACSACWPCSRLFGERFAAAPVSFVATRPAHGAGVAFALELLISCGLMLTVLGFSSRARLAPYTGLAAGALVASYIALEAPYSGMSMNPARSFASAAPAGLWSDLWIYFVAPPLGMWVAAALYGGRAARRGCAKLVHAADVRCIHCGFEPAASAAALGEVKP